MNKFVRLRAQLSWQCITAHEPSIKLFLVFELFFFVGESFNANWRNIATFCLFSLWFFLVRLKSFKTLLKLRKPLRNASVWFKSDINSFGFYNTMGQISLWPNFKMIQVKKWIDTQTGQWLIQTFVEPSLWCWFSNRIRLIADTNPSNLQV